MKFYHLCPPGEILLAVLEKSTIAPLEKIPSDDHA